MNNFRDWIFSSSKTLYESCVNPQESLKEKRNEHNYARPWIEDPTICSALPVVDLFNVDGENDSTIDVDQSPTTNEKLIWPPTTFELVPDRFEFSNFEFSLDERKTKIFEKIRKFLDETRLAALSSESISNVVYFRLALHRILFQFDFFLEEFNEFLEQIDLFHEQFCKTFDRITLGHYIDLFRILYDENPKIRSAFEKIQISNPEENLSDYVLSRIVEKTSDLTEEFVFSLSLSNFPSPTVCLIIPGMSFENHLKRVEFWRKNLSQLSTVFVSSSIDEKEFQIQQAYDDVLKKFHEIRQIYPNHKIVFLSWNVGCVLALKAALLCPISVVVCFSLPFEALSEDSKKDFTKINASILFIEPKVPQTEKIDRFRRRLKSRNGLVRLDFCDDQLRMTEQGKFRFRLTQQIIEKFLMEQIIDFLIVLSSRTIKSNEQNEENEFDVRRKRIERIERLQTSTIVSQDESEEIFLFSSENLNSTSLTINPEQDPQTRFINTTFHNSTTSRKRKTTNKETNKNTNKDPTVSTTKRGRQKTKDQPTTRKPSTKKSKQSITTTPTTSILNTLLQLPTNQPKNRAMENNLSKSFN